MDDKDKKNFDDLIIRKSESKSKNVPNDFDALITRKSDSNSNKSTPKSTLVTPSSPNIDINRAEKKTQIRGTTSGIVTDMSDNPFKKEDTKPKQTILDSSSKIPDPVLPTRSGFSVKNPSKNAGNTGPKPQKMDLLDPIVPSNTSRSSATDLPSRKPTIDTTPKSTIPDRTGKVSVARPTGEKITEKPNVVSGSQKTAEPINFKKPDIKKKEEKDANILKQKVGETKKPQPDIIVDEKKPIEKRQAPATPKPEEPQVIKTTTSTLKKKKPTEIPEDISQDIGAKAGSKKYKADTRLDRRAKSLKKYGKEFERWRRSQEIPEEEEIEGDVRVKEGRNSERVITTALILVVIMILSLFLLFYCNILVPDDNYDDGRIRISVEIEKEPFTDVDILGNVSEKVIFPGDYIDFNITATNAYNIMGDNATSFIWDSIFLRFKIYLRIDGEMYENVKVNINNTGTKTVPVLIPTIAGDDTFQTYDPEKEALYIDPIKNAPIVEASDGFYYYNGILDYNQSLTLCEGVLFNGDAIIPEFANKRVELVVVVDAATSDYTSIRERTIWEEAPQAWIEYMHETYFSDIV